MSKRMSLAICAGLAVAVFDSSAGSSAADGPQTMLLTPGVIQPIAKIDERFLSYNVEMAEVIGGKFWRPYTPASIAALKAQAASPAPPSGGGRPPVAGHDPTMFQARPPIDLSNARLRKLAAALAPAYMRTSGTWANSIYFDDSDSPPPPNPPADFQGVLTRSEWKNVIDFSQSVGAKLVTSFAISAGVRESLGVWTPDQARKLVTYTKEAGGDIAAAEFFNEPDMPVFGGAPTGYKAADYARDFSIFRKFAAANAPDMVIVGPGSVGSLTKTYEPSLEDGCVVFVVGRDAWRPRHLVISNALIATVRGAKDDAVFHHEIYLCGGTNVGDGNDIVSFALDSMGVADHHCHETSHRTRTGDDRGA